MSLTPRRLERNIAPRNVQEHLRKLQEQGVIHRVGPDKGGHWEK